MGLIAWFKKRCKRFRYVVKLDDEPYLVRYRLLDTPWLGVYLHHIIRDDNHRHLHDHPFNFWTLILWNGYLEWYKDPQTPSPMDQQYRVRRPLTLVRHKAEDLHRITLRRRLSDTGYGSYACWAWTLFIRGRKRREWGFLTEEGWVDWNTYQAAHEKKAEPTDCRRG